MSGFGRVTYLRVNVKGGGGGGRSKILKFYPVQTSTAGFPKLLCSRTPFSFENITTKPHSLAHINIQSPDDRYPKLNFCIT